MKDLAIFGFPKLSSSAPQLSPVVRPAKPIASVEDPDTPRVHPSAHYARVVATILCDIPCCCPLPRGPVYGDSLLEVEAAISEARTKHNRRYIEFFRSLRGKPILPGAPGSGAAWEWKYDPREVEIWAEKELRRSSGSYSDIRQSGRMEREFFEELADHYYDHEVIGDAYNPHRPSFKPTENKIKQSEADFLSKLKPQPGDEKKDKDKEGHLEKEKEGRGGHHQKEKGTQKQDVKQIQSQPRVSTFFAQKKEQVYYDEKEGKWKKRRVDTASTKDGGGTGSSRSSPTTDSRGTHSDDDIVRDKNRKDGGRDREGRDRTGRDDGGEGGGRGKPGGGDRRDSYSHPNDRRKDKDKKGHHKKKARVLGNSLDKEGEEAPEAKSRLHMIMRDSVHDPYNFFDVKKGEHGAKKWDNASNKSRGKASLYDDDASRKGNNKKKKNKGDGDDGGDGSRKGQGRNKSVGVGTDQNKSGDKDKGKLGLGDKDKNKDNKNKGVNTNNQGSDDEWTHDAQGRRIKRKKDPPKTTNTGTMTDEQKRLKSAKDEKDKKKNLGQKNQAAQVSLASGGDAGDLEKNRSRRNLKHGGDDDDWMDDWVPPARNDLDDAFLADALGGRGDSRNGRGGKDRKLNTRPWSSRGLRRRGRWGRGKHGLPPCTPPNSLNLFISAGPNKSLPEGGNNLGLWSTTGTKNFVSFSQLRRVSYPYNTSWLNSQKSIREGAALVTQQSQAGETRVRNILCQSFPTASDVVVEDISEGCGSVYKVFIEDQSFDCISKLVKMEEQANQILRKEITQALRTYSRC